MKKSHKNHHKRVRHKKVRSKAKGATVRSRTCTKANHREMSRNNPYQLRDDGAKALAESYWERNSHD